MGEPKAKIWYRPNAAPGRRWEISFGGLTIWADIYREANEIVEGMKRAGRA